MSENNTKSWERPWTTQEMIDNSANWSLAGDAGLLKYLEQFSDKISTKSKETNDKLEELEKNVTEASISLANVHNEFMGLHNTQFIESRVYEDDETLPTPVQQEKEVKHKQTDAEKIEEIKNAILEGLKITDEFYEKVEIQDSDSEDDIDEPSVVFQPIDKYSDRPLPYVIGSSEWHKHWHVGLLESSSESETENQNEEFSESDSDHEISNFPIRDRSQIPGISDSNSESDVTRDNQSIRKEPTLFNNTDNMFESSSDSETESIGAKPTETSKFAAELAAKLGKVEATTVHNENEINKKAIKKQPDFGGLFSDEPPPLDESEDVSKPIKTGLFSGGQGLFDDDEDEADNFWNPNPKLPIATKSKETTKKTEDIFANENDDNIFAKKEDSHISSADTKKKKIVSGGLFDDDDEDYLFSALPTKSEPIKPSLFSDEPPEIVQETTATKKKPVGIKSPFGDNKSLLSEVASAVKNKDIQKPVLENIPASKPIEKESPPKEDKTITAKQESPKPEKTKKKVINLFDDELLFNDDIFSSTASKFKTDLFDNTVKSDLFGDEIISDKEERPTSLFDDDKIPKSSNKVNKKPVSLFSPDSPDDDIFGEKTIPETKSKGSLFSPEPLESSKKIVQKTSVPVPSEKSNIPIENPLPKSTIGEVPDKKIENKSLETNIAKKNKSLSLFSDEEDDSSSIFEEKKDKLSSIYSASEQNKKSLFDIGVAKKKTKQISLFSSEEDEDENDEEPLNSVKSKIAIANMEQNADPLFTAENMTKIKISKPISLFDDNEDAIFPTEDKIKTTAETSKQPSIPTIEPKSDPLATDTIPQKKTKAIPLFSSEEDDGDLFKISDKPKTTESKKDINTSSTKKDTPKVELFSETPTAPFNEEVNLPSEKTVKITSNLTDTVDKSVKRETELLSENPPLTEIEKNISKTVKPELSINSENSKSEKIETESVKNDPVISIFSSEPPPLDNVISENPSTILSSDVENDLFSNVSKDAIKSDDNSSNNIDFDSDILASGSLNQQTVNRKLSDGRLDLFSDNYVPNSGNSSNKGGLFDWCPPELDQPPPLKASNERLDDKKSNSGLFSDEDDDLFSMPSNTNYSKNSSWLDQEPPPLDDLNSQKKEAKLSLFSDDDLFKPKNDDLFKQNQSTNETVDNLNSTKTIEPKKQKTADNLFENNTKISQEKLEKIDTNINEDNIKSENIQHIKKHPLFETEANNSLFIDNTILEDDIFAKPNTSEKISDNLVENSTNSDPLMENRFHKNDKKSEKQEVFSSVNSNSLFSDDKNLFSEIEKTKKIISLPADKTEMKKDSKPSKISSSLFSDEEEIPEEPLKKDIPKSNKSLFSEDSDEDLFSTSSNKSKMKANDESKIKSYKNIPPTSKPKASTGKLKHNLNINVAALLPGAAPKLSKENSPEEKIEDRKSIENDRTPTSEFFPDSPIDNVDVLTSAAKQRVRIPTKRRPSTRKARHEAIRKSGMEFNFEGEYPESQETVENVQTAETEKNKQNEANNNPTDNTANIFTDNVKKSSKDSKIQKKDSLFDDSESIFKTKKKPTVEKKNLFDDDDEDDDIFNSKISKPAATNTGSSSQANKKPASRIKKLTAHSQDIHDPLDVINK